MTGECGSCLHALAGQRGLYHAGCPGCSARMLAVAYFDCGIAEAVYQRMLVRHGITHDQVKAAHAADTLNRSRA